MLKKSSLLCSSCGGLQLLNTTSSTSGPRRRRVPPSPPTPRLLQQCRQYASVRDDHPYSEDELSWPSSHGFTPYDIFRQERGAPYSKRRFYDLVKIYHPDRPSNGHPSCDDISEAVRLQRYRLVVAAHEILSNPEKRLAYDRFGTGWHQHPDVGSTRRPDEQWTPTYRDPGFDDSIYANATWEDWERWYRRGEGQQSEATHVSHSTFASFVILLTVFVGIANASTIGSFTTSYEERLRNMNEKTGQFLNGRRSGTVGQLDSRDARIHNFLIKRDPRGQGLKGEEQDTYKRVLGAEKKSAAIASLEAPPPAAQLPPSKDA